MQKPSTILQKTLAQHNHHAHPAQLACLQPYDELSAYIWRQQKPLQKLISTCIRHKPQLNLYLWGDVGQGKSLITDCFCQSLPPNSYLRQHFHAFMLNIHSMLQLHKGHKNPLQLIAKDLQRKISVLCLDEFYIDNIVDAMLIGKLFQALATKKISVVTNSNIKPCNLYKNGVQRQLFLQTIQLIQDSFLIMHLDTNTDYRQQQHILPQLYIGDNASAKLFMQQHWNMLCTQDAIPQTLQLFNRNIAVKAVSQTTLWLSFAALCSPPRAVKDYIFMCQNYQHILIDTVTPTKNQNLIYNWMKFIDICYDSPCEIIIATTATLGDIYTGSDRLVRYKRCLSRLEELLSSKQLDN